MLGYTPGPMPTRKKPNRRGRRAGRFRELTPAELRWVCRPSDYDFSVAVKDVSMIGIIGQERAIRALKLGIALYAPGYNVFVCGITGTGRASTVKKILEKIKGFCPVAPDRCYVHNFTKPDEPRLLSLPRGLGRRLQADMERLSREIPTMVTASLDSSDLAKKRDRIITHYEAQADRLIERFERRAEKAGFALKRVHDGKVSRPELFPIIEKRAHPMSDVDTLVAGRKLTRRKADAVVKTFEGLRIELTAAGHKSRTLIKKMAEEVETLEQDHVMSELKEELHHIVEPYPDPGRETVTGYLDGVAGEIAGNLVKFRRHPWQEEEPAGDNEEEAAPEEDDTRQEGIRQFLDRFRVNLIFDSRRVGDCPVVVESHPSYRRLFGSFEKKLDQTGHWTTDYTRIRGGSLLAADGGYLVLTAEDLCSETKLWKELKRTLISRTLAITVQGDGNFPAVTIKPQPIPVNTKVILIGMRETYENLLYDEHDFRKIFKVLADFAEETERTQRTMRQYAAFVRKTCTDEGLGELDAPAVAAVTEYGARLAGHQKKLSTRFGEIADLLREADYWKGEEGSGRKIRAAHVRRAIEESIRRRDLPEEKLQEMIRENQIIIDVTGERVGQVNGLVIQDSGGHEFGLPARITATVSPGTAGIINIEREASMSGASHTKGVLIIGGLLREIFGATRPITLTASLAVEQSYDGIDGDSASSTEVYALLSALSGIPLKQVIAVTGSINQKGEIQPVGGINRKIEGFYRVCQTRGLTGGQGVIVPESNLPGLMLNTEVVAAVRGKRFHIWPVKSVQEGIEILAGVPAGEREPSGRFPLDSLFGRVEERLAGFHSQVRGLASFPRM